MAFKDFPAQEQGIQLLQRSLQRGRLAHGYLFSGSHLGELEAIARNLAKTLNCQQPVRCQPSAEPPSGSPAVDCCDQCLACQKIEHGNHADVHWVRPESRMRVITIEQMRGLMQEIFLKPTEADYKICIVSEADRLNEKAANAFLKTLEEPPTRSILILLTTEPQRMLETIVSRCLRLNFAGDPARSLEEPQRVWIESFCQMAAAEQKSLLGRYCLMDVLLSKLTEVRAGIEETLTARSPLQHYKDAEKSLVDKWEDELTAAIEAEYRRQRSSFLVALQWWLRDVWLETVRHHRPGRPEEAEASQLLYFPQLSGTRVVAGRISPSEAMENLRVVEQLQRWLNTNVQEALAMEVGLLKLHL